MININPLVIKRLSAMTLVALSTLSVGLAECDNHYGDSPSSTITTCQNGVEYKQTCTTWCCPGQSAGTVQYGN